MKHRNIRNPGFEFDPEIEFVTVRETVTAAAVLLAVALLVLGANFFSGETVAPMDILANQPGWHEAGIDVEAASPHRTDILDGLLPRWLFLKRAMRSGSLPTWNPLPGGGEPGWQLLFNGALAPRFLIFLLFDDAVGFGLGIVFQLVTAGLGAYLLTRLWTGRPGGYFAAVTFMLCGFNVSWMMWPHAATAAWIPWVVWAVARAMDLRTRRSAAVLAIVTAFMVFGGFPAIAAYGLYLASAYAAIRGIAALRSGRSLREGVVECSIAGAGLLMGILLAAVQILPSLEFLHFFDLGHRGPIGAAIDPRSLFFTPLSGGMPHPETTGYAGLLALALALIGALPRAAARTTAMTRIGAMFWTGTMVFSLAAALRIPAPVADVIYRLPGLDINPNNRWLVIYGLTVAVLAGLGLDRLVSAVRGPDSNARGRWAAVAAAALIAVQVVDLARISREQNAVVPAWTFFPETSVTRWLQDTIEPGQSVIAEGFLTAGTLSGYGLPEWFAHGFHTGAEKALLGEIVTDAWVTHTAAFPSFSHADLTAVGDFNLLSIRFFVTPCATARDVLDQQPRGRPDRSMPLTAGLEIRQPLILDRKAVVSGVAVLISGTQQAGGSVELVLRTGSGEVLAEGAIPAREISGIAYVDVLLTDRLELQAGTYELELRSRIVGQPPRIWLRSTPTGGLAVNGSPHPGSLACDVLAPLEAPPPWRHAMVSDGLCVFENTRTPDGAVLVDHNDPSARVEALGSSSGSAQYRVTTTSPGTLVRSTRCYPGWEASISGVPTAIAPYRDALQSIRIEPGESIVTWTYEPRSLKIGFALTTIGLAVVGWLCIIPRRSD